MQKDKLLELALQKLGMTEQELLAENFKKRIIELAAAKHTIKEMLEISEKEGWLDAFYSVRFVDMMPSRAEKPAPKTTYRRGERLTRAQARELEHGIVDFLHANPRSPIAAIAKHVGFDVQKVRTKLMLMKSAGSIAAEGTGRDMVYLTADE